MVKGQKATLLQLRRGPGSQKKDEVLAQKEVWIKQERVYAKTLWEAQAAGVKLETTAGVYRKAFESGDYTHCRIGERIYKIESALQAGNSQTVTLLLSRG